MKCDCGNQQNHLLTGMEMVGFEIHRVKDLAGFASHRDFQTHKIQEFEMLWQDLLFLHCRNFYLELKK